MTAEGDVGALIQISASLRERDWTLATAESCTGGLVGKLLTDLPGASAFYLGGVIAYANPAKVDQLGVSPADLDVHGAVSEVTARQMAVGVAQRFCAQVGLSVTGVAGPGGGTDEKPVGVVWMAVSVLGGVVARQERFSGSRAEVRLEAAHAVIRMALEALSDDERT